MSSSVQALLPPWLQLLGTGLRGPQGDCQTWPSLALQLGKWLCCCLLFCSQCVLSVFSLLKGSSIILNDAIIFKLPSEKPPLVCFYICICFILDGHRSWDTHQSSPQRLRGALAMICCCCICRCSNSSCNCCWCSCRFICISCCCTSVSGAGLRCRS